MSYPKSPTNRALSNMQQLKLLAVDTSVFAILSPQMSAASYYASQISLGTKVARNESMHAICVEQIMFQMADRGLVSYNVER